VAKFLQPTLETLDHDRFHLTLFPTVARWDSRAEHLCGLADNVVMLASTSDDDEAVDMIRREKIDVLMDTSGHTLSNRLGIFARRAAPVQCTYIGYWSTTGLTEMDWVVAHDTMPRHLDSHFSEGLWRITRSVSCYY